MVRKRDTAELLETYIDCKKHVRGRMNSIGVHTLYGGGTPDILVAGNQAGTFTSSMMSSTITGL